MINNNSKPLIILGSRKPIGKIKRVCRQHKIEIAGMIDGDYFGNTEWFEDILVIDSEQAFLDPDKLSYYKTNFNFFLATSWTPESNQIMTRNRQRRNYLISLIEKYDLPCVSLIDRSSMIDPSAKIGKNVFIDCFCIVEESATIGDFTAMYGFSGIAHNCIVGKNCVIHGKAGTTSDCIIEDECYLGINSGLWRSNIILKKGTVVHPNLAVHRSTEENEIISLAGKDLRRIYNNTQLVD
jgi:NDP-sugar pyrophosphorylase family protein